MSDLYSAYETFGHDLRVYLGPVRGDLDESTITGSWVPSGGSWTDKSTTIKRGSVSIEHDGVGFTASFTVEDEARSTWADDLAVAFVARFWSSGAYTSWETICWGYLDGSDRQRLGLMLRQTGERTVTYAGYWDKRNVPAMRLGRRNLADGASIHASDTALSTPDDEAPLEYIAQDDCAASKIIDQNADTVAVLAVVADPARPTLGDTERPKFLRVWTDETGTPALEVWCGYNLTTWGDFTTPASVPNLFESGANTRDDDSAKVEYTSGRMIVTAKQNTGNPYQMHGPQWNISCGDRPLRVAFRYKAGDSGSIGKALHITHGTQSTVTLSNTWQDYAISLDKAQAIHDVLVLRFQGGDNNNADSNLSTQTMFEIDDLRVSVGYSDMYFQKNDSGYKMSLATDNGAGTEAVVRIAGNIAPWEDWRIPADDSVIFAYNPAEFKAKHNPGHRAVYALRNAIPSFSIKQPTNGTRVKLCYASSAIRDDYDHASVTTVQEIDFDVANGGVAWEDYQSLSRQSPLGTGTLTPEDHPRVGLYPDELGTGYWWVDLGAYTPTYLTQPVASGASKVIVADPDEFPASGSAYIAGDEFAYTGKDDHTLTGCTGISGDKVAGALIYPKASGAAQSGPLVDVVELRRKPGTPTILAGAVIYSNAASPTDPSTVDGLGKLWERQADWELAHRWDYGDATTGIETVTIPAPGGYVQARHWCIVVDRMARDSTGTIAQRVKLNEFIAWQYRPGSGSGDYSSTGPATIGAAIAYLLTTYGPVPAAKTTLDSNGSAPLGDLPLAPAKLARDVGALCTSGLLTVALDHLNAVTIEPDPSSTRFTRAATALTLTSDVAMGEIEATWTTAHQVAQVRVQARDVVTFRTYVVSYPTRAATLGEVVEVKDVHVRSAQEARDLAESIFRARNARRTYRATIGAAPWLRARQRIVVDSAELDSGGEHEGVNCLVSRFRHRIEDAGGLLVWTSEIEIQEWAL